MGKAYSQHNPYPEEKDQVFITKPYSTEYDSLFKYYENDLNLLKYLELLEFQQVLYNFNSSKDEVYNFSNPVVNNEYDYNIGKIMFTVFVDKKIVNHFLVFPNIADDEKLLKRSIAFYSLIFDNIYKNYKYYLKKLSRDEGQKAQNDKIKKLCLLSLAFVYCRAKSNFYKVLFIYNLFANDKKEIVNTGDLEIFFFFVLLFPSNIYLKTMNDLGEEFEELKINEDLFLKIYETFEVKDSKRLLDLTFEKIFQGQQSVDFNTFVSNIQKVDWIFSPAGIRKALKDNNDN
jgi:hypothetical protein